MRKNLLRAKLLLAAAVLVTLASRTGPAAASFCRMGSFLTTTEQECVDACSARTCPHYSWDGAICTCSLH
jgi:hypothetical protein